MILVFVRWLVLWSVVVLAVQAHAMEWSDLDAMRQAVQELNYRGEYIYRRGDETSAYSIVRYVTSRHQVELLKQLDGDMIEVLRDGEKVVCYIPAGSEAALNRPVPAAPYSLLAEVDWQLISQNYQATMIGEQRVAGYQTKVIELSGDEWRYRKRYWIAEDSHMLLQSEIRDQEDQVLEQFRFTRLELDPAINLDDVEPSLAQEAAVQQTIYYQPDPVVMTDMDFQSAVNWLPEGFLLSGSKRTAHESGWTEQRTYSDGLASFTLFVEFGEQFAPAVARMGATTAMMFVGDGMSGTLVGEIPVSTARQISSSIQPQQTSF